MSALLFALSQEAKPWIEGLGLKPENKQGHFRFYRSEKHTAVISGPGKLSMAMAVTELAHKIPKKDRHPGYRIWNLGICGSANKSYARGDFFWVNKIHDYAQKRDFYPEKIEKIGTFSETNLTTFDRPISHHKQADPNYFLHLPEVDRLHLELVDMEASGFFEAASIYFELSQICVGKVVSDHLEGILCDVSQVHQWMQMTRVNLADTFLTDGINVINEILSENEWEHWMGVGKKLHFTESMLAELKKSITYFKLQNPTSTIPIPTSQSLDRPFEKRDAKSTFIQWKNNLHA
jgi:hypothetical protein